jgi:hypothetical protein
MQGVFGAVKPVMLNASKRVMQHPSGAFAGELAPMRLHTSSRSMTIFSMRSIRSTGPGI